MEVPLHSFSSSELYVRRCDCRLLRPLRSSCIMGAVSRTKKAETLQKLKQELENCHLLAGICYKGFTVKQMQDLRKSLPDAVKLVVAKNSLVGKAAEGTPWEAVKPCLNGMSAWMFVHTEDIQSALKPVRNFQKVNQLEDNDFTGAVFEGKFYGTDEFKMLETMPTRAEVYAKIAGSLQGPAWSLIRVLQVPARDLILILIAYIKKMEEDMGH